MSICLACSREDEHYLHCGDKKDTSRRLPAILGIGIQGSIGGNCRGGRKHALFGWASSAPPLSQCGMYWFIFSPRSSSLFKPHGIKSYAPLATIPL